MEMEQNETIQSITRKESTGLGGNQGENDNGLGFSINKKEEILLYRTEAFYSPPNGSSSISIVKKAWKFKYNPLITWLGSQCMPFVYQMVSTLCGLVSLVLVVL